MKQVYFIRHGWDWEKKLGSEYVGLNQYLFDNRLVAIHFDNKPSWKDGDYDSASAKSAIRYMNDCDASPDEKIVFASYSFHDKVRVLYGTPKKNSKHILSSKGKWSNIKELKVLQLETDGRELSLDEFPFAFLLAPQRSTFVHWRQCEQVANAQLFGKGLDLFTPTHYLPWVVELLCEEFLRRTKKLDKKLFRTGGTLKDLDIVGFDSTGRLILSQVKNDDKRKAQRAFEKTVSEVAKSQDVIGYYFYNGEERTSLMPNVVMTRISTVLESFRDETDYLGRLQLVNMRSQSLVST